MRLRRRSRCAAVLALLLAGCGPGGSPDPPASVASVAPVAVAAPADAAPAAQPGPERLDAPAPVRPAQPALEVRYEAALVGDPCTDRDLPAAEVADAALAVLDRSYALPASYVPDDLAAAADAGLTGGSGGKLVREIVVEDLAAMRAAWEAEGLAIIIDSAYRSYAAQAGTFNGWVARLGHADALARAARPGHSEHQLGTAIDVSSPGWTGRFGDWAIETAEGRWMADHAWEYGFVMSYPAGAQAETCFGYEPWHYRWIGRELAAEHREEGRTLRDFLERRLGG